MPPPMPWQKMMFKNDPVWVLVDESGRPVLDRDGRAEMKYRENDPRSYRPGATNLLPVGDGTAPRDRPAPTLARVPTPSREAGSRVPPAPSEPAAPRFRRAAERRNAAEPVNADPGALEIWTDGACSGNPGPMGIGVVVIDGAWRDEIGEYLGLGTNNIAELVAIERGVEASLKRIATTSRRVRIHTDSSYAIGLLSKGWKAKANQELVERIRKKLATYPAALKFVKVAGHAGIPENERCDELARLAVERRGS